MKKGMILCSLLIIFSLSLVSGLGDRFIFMTSNGNITLNTSLMTGTKLNWSDLLNVPGGFTDTQKAGGGYYLYNDSTTIYLNETRLNSTIDDRAVGGGGSNVSELTNLTDVTISSPSNRSILYYNSDSSQWLNILLDTLVTTLGYIKDLSGFDTDDLSQGSSNLYDNTSWNQPLADTLYADISQTDTNETTRVNTIVGTDCGAGNYSYGFDASGNIQCREDQNTGGGGGNTTEEIQDAIGGGLNKTLSYDDINNKIGVNNTWLNSSIEAYGYITTDTNTNCSSDGSCSLITYDSETTIWDKNVSDDFDGTWGSLSGIPAGFADGVDNTSTGGVDWTEITSIPAGFDDDIDNDTTYDGTDFRVQSWDNLTGIPHATPSNGDVTHFSLADEIYDWVIGLAYATVTYVDSLGNWSADSGNYYNSTQTDSAIVSANSSMKTYVDNVADTDTWATNYTDYYNITDILGFGYYNSTDFDITDYYTSAEIESFSYYNSTNPQPDSNLTEDDVEGYIFDTDNTANLGMGNYNVTNVSYVTLCNGANCWKFYVNGSDYFIIEEI